MLPCIDHGGSKDYANCSFNGRFTMKHRRAYCQHNGVTLESIDGLVVRHQCDNKRCIEGTHLMIGSQADNIRDTAGKVKSNVTTRVLEDHEVAEVRRLFTLGATRKELSARFGVTYQTVKQIILGTRR